jgi:hypothetical protein
MRLEGTKGLVVRREVIADVRVLVKRNADVCELAVKIRKLD